MAPADPDTERSTVRHPANSGDALRTAATLRRKATKPRALPTDPDGTAEEADEGAERTPSDWRRQGQEKSGGGPIKLDVAGEGSTN